MTSGFGPPWLLIADYYALATCLLLGAGLASGRLEQPARRLAVAWSTLVGLTVLLVLVAVPEWPRTSLVTESARETQVQPGSSPLIAVDPTRLAPPSRSEEIPRSAEARPAPFSADPPRRPQVASGRPTDAPPNATARHWQVPSWPALLGGSFLVGATAMLGWLALGSWQTASVRRRAKRASEGLRSVLARVVGAGGVPPDLLVSDVVRQPVAVGTWRPTIILPDRMVEEESEVRLEAALAHEWAHIRNRDLWLIALIRLLLPVLYAHPGYWWLRRRVRDDQEALADASASVVGGRLSYAEVLLSWSRKFSGPTPFAAGGSVALFERPSQIKWRIILLLNQSFPIETSCPGWWRLAVRGASILAVLGLSLITLRPMAVGQDKPEQDATPSAPVVASPDQTAASARLLGPDGKPFAGAKVYVSDWKYGSGPPWKFKTSLLGTTGGDGSFQVDAKPEESKSGIRSLVLTADGFGPAFLIPKGKDTDKTTPLSLVRDDVPIRGRVLDIRGRPVAGAQIQVVGVLWHPSGKLDEWLAELRDKKEALPVEYTTLRSWSNDAAPFFPPIVADQEGRFTVKGVGRERIASLLIGGPGIETTFSYVVTRAMPTIKFPDFLRQPSSHDIVYHGAEFDLVVGPDAEVVGTVTDQDTGKPLADIHVGTAALFGNHPTRTLDTTTDAQGHYRLGGIPPKTNFNDNQALLITALDGRPYLPAIRSLGEVDVARPITKDLQLKRGVLAQGRVAEKATGKGVRSNLSYSILADNPSLKTYPKYGTVRAGMPYRTDDEGNFKLVVMPGPGILGARAHTEQYRLGVGLDTIQGLKSANNPPNEIYDTRPEMLVAVNYHTVAGIDPKVGDESVTCEIRLDRGKTVQGTLVDPDGKPLIGARIEGLQDYFRSWSNEPLPTAGFVVEGIGTGDSRDLLICHDEKKLAASFVVKADETGPITITLQPSGALTGRLIGAGGLPLADAQLTSSVGSKDESHEFGSIREPIRTDKDGRFRAEGLAPGRKYQFLHWVNPRADGRRYVEMTGAKDVVAASGETRDLGDLTVLKGN